MTLRKEKGKLVPISPQNAQWNVIKEYNDKHKDKQIELTAAESFKVADAYAWVLEGRYDAFFDIKLSFEKAVTDKRWFLPPICRQTQLVCLQRNSNLTH